jgi:hypothetical protein
MITNSHPHIFILALTIIFLLLLPIINCKNDQIKELSIENQIRTPTGIKNRLYNILKAEKLNSNSDEEEEIEQLIGDFIKPYPHRRASSFYAMRGKRFIKTA